MSTLTAVTAATSRAHLPSRALERAVTQAGGIRMLAKEQDRYAALARSYYRAIKTGLISVWAADSICCHLLRVHPAYIYGDDWWMALEQMDYEDAPAFVS